MIHIREDELVSFANDELDVERARQVKEHLSVCRPCHQQFLLIQELTIEWQEPSTHSSVDLTDQVMNTLFKSPPAVSVTPRASRWKIYVHFGLAATAAILFSFFNATDALQEKSEKVIVSATNRMEKVETAIKQKNSILGSISIKWTNGGDK